MSKPFRNLKALAAHLGLSPATVSRVLNGKSEEGRISEETRRRVLEAVERHGLIRNAVARGLKMARTHTLGLLVPDIRNPFFGAIAQSIVKRAREQQYSVLLCDNEEDEGIEQRQLALLADRRVDGIIAAPIGTEPTHWNTLQQSGMPICLVDRYFSQSAIPYVSSDNRQGACDATRHLLERGHRRIAVIQGNPRTTVNAERLAGVRDGFSGAGLSWSSEGVVGDDFGELNGYTHARELLAPDNLRPTAIFAFSNMIAMGVMRAANERGVRLPVDLSLIAFDEQRYSQFLSPPLTTIAQDVEEIGERTVDLLLCRIHGDPIPSQTLIPTRLLERDSVAMV